MGISECIKELCNNNNISIAKLEKELGFGNGTIRNWSTNSPSGDKLQKVSNYFNVSVDHILGKVDKILNPSEKRIIDSLARATDLDEEDYDIIADQVERLIEYAKKKKRSQ